MLKIGIIIGSTRIGRLGDQVANWVGDNLKNHQAVVTEIIDLRDYHLPFLGESEDLSAVKKWNELLATFDGFIFVAAEYNHGMTGVLKNAIDSAKDPWFNKVAGIVSYGSSYGARSAEQLRLVLAEVQVATVRNQVLLSLFTDVENFKTFKPNPMHKNNLEAMVTQMVAWGNKLKELR